DADALLAPVWLVAGALPPLLLQAAADVATSAAVPAANRKCLSWRRARATLTIRVMATLHHVVQSPDPPHDGGTTSRLVLLISRYGSRCTQLVQVWPSLGPNVAPKAKEQSRP